MISVSFVYCTGIAREIFRNVRLLGSWDGAGRFADSWSAAPMTLQELEDGAPSYVAEVTFDPLEVGRQFRWGVRLDGPAGPDLWGIPTEIGDSNSTDRYRSFILTAAGNQQRYYLTHCRRLGAQKRHLNGAGTAPTIEFSVWAPNAKAVEIVAGVFGKSLGVNNSGYIADDGTGIDRAFGGSGEFPMSGEGDGVWRSNLASALADFKLWDHRTYMFKVTKDDGSVAYRTDLYSRCQIGKGRIDPNGARYDGAYSDLDGTKSCSVVIDPETITADFVEAVFPETRFIRQDEFWRNEFDPARPVPQHIEDIVIYELHVGSLGYQDPNRDGSFGDVMSFLDYLVDLGVNAVELLPVLQFEGGEQWGYGTSHPFALEFSAGGRDQLKHVIRACHQRGIAVILDVVYNHYHVDSERAEWAYDSNAPEKNIYYWYEGHSTDYGAYEQAAARDPQHVPPGHGGYLDNDSTGYDPRFYEEMIRKWLISSAVALLEDFHVDGFRVDLPQAIYAFNQRHADGVPVDSANAFGAKFLREWTRTMKMIKPNCFLIAEDHSDQALVTDSPDLGGLGFDATWYSTFYHHLIGDGNYPSYAQLLRIAGSSDNAPLMMDYFADALDWTGHHKVVYHKDHDDAGNAFGTARNMVVAVNGAPLVGATRMYAEARCRTVCGLTMLSAGTPMFLMFEEIGSSEPMPFKGFRHYRDDYDAARRGNGAASFKFYGDLIRLRLGRKALRSHEIEAIHMHDANRVIAFLRTDGLDRFLVVASLNNQAFTPNYWIATDRLGAANWQEVFNSDASIYGGRNIGNGGAVIASTPAGVRLAIPSTAFVVLQQL
jgi:1,4-alpha-glucan branching enzyme